MRSTWAAAAIGFAIACASASNQIGAREKPAPGATAPAPAPSDPSTAPAASRPMTAAEAAEKAHQDWIRSRGVAPPN